MFEFFTIPIWIVLKIGEPFKFFFYHITYKLRYLLVRQSNKNIILKCESYYFLLFSWHGNIESIDFAIIVLTHDKKLNTKYTKSLRQTKHDLFIMTVSFFYFIHCVCVKRITLCNCLCSSSCCFSASFIQNIGEFGATNYFTDHWRANKFSYLLI